MYKGEVWMAFGSTTSNLVTIECLDPVNGTVSIPQKIPVYNLGCLHMFEADTLYLVVGENHEGDSCESGEDSA